MRCAKEMSAGALSICLMGLVSCSVVAPADRIRENPAMYHNLPSEQQTLVQQGRICNGMNQDAVFLAWGMPNDMPLVGQDGKTEFVKWVYTRMRPVMVSRPYWGGFYGPGCWGPYCGGGSDTAYVPEVCATVTFEKGKVTEWERRAPRFTGSAPSTPSHP